MGYIQFLQMIPEATLMAILVILFFVDFFSTPSGACAQGESGAVCRSWMNPLAGVLILAQTLICLFFSQPVTLFGGMYVATPAVAVMKTILTAGTLVVVVQSRLWMSREDTMNKEGEFYMLLVSTLLGMYVMMSAGHFLMFFLGLEMASVPMACLVALDKYRHHSAEAAAKYILTATFSSGVMLYGLSMLYAATGKLSFTMLASALSLHHHPALVVLGLVFFLSGLAFKLSLVPFHFWTADTYQGAPTTVTGYLSVISKGAAAFILAVLLVKVFPAFSDQWLMWLYILIVLSITVGNLFAIRQSNLKRFMAFSSISQAGYIVLAIVGGAANLPESQALSMTALSYYVLVYVAANLAVFAVISVVEEKNGGRTDIDAYNGFYQTNPKLSLLMTLALFSLAGIPPFAGMFSKFFVFMAAAREGSFGAYLVVFIALVNTVVSLYYYLLIVKAMYIKNSDAPLPTFRSDNGTRLALFLCTAGILLFGIFSCFYQWIFAAAEF